MAVLTVLLCQAAWAADQPAPQAAPTPPTPEERELQEMLSIVDEFQEQTQSYKKEIQQIIEAKYEEQRKAVVASYESAINELEQEENSRREEAVEVFERFLATYPDDPRYTPGALWRLAELHYEKAKLALTQAEDTFEREMRAFQRNERKSEPRPPEAHFERTVELLQRLLRDFPGYKLIDGAQYLLAYCLQEQGEPVEAQAVWTAFVNQYPNSRLLPEVWTRLGESYFEDPDKQDKAIEAYSQVLRYPDSPMYDKAMYKLAWTYYKVDRFSEAVDRFDQLVVWADAGAVSESGEVDAARTELRREAMQYLAISFSEDEWTGAGPANARAFFQGRGGRAYEPEFFRLLGEVYFLDAKYERSVEALREAIDRQPEDPGNPKLMSSIIDAYYRLQRPEDATRAQEELVRRFGSGSKWYLANQDKAEVLAEADKLAEGALYAAAVRHHTLAQRLKEQQRPEDARLEYSAAAAAYRDYLQRFPRTRDAYRLNYYLAECFYYSLQFRLSAEAYSQVRDDPASAEFLADAANSAVLSWLNLIKEAEASGELPPLQLYTSRDRPAGMVLEARPIPDLRQKLIEACDVYAAKLPNDEQAGNMAFRAAQVLYGYDHFDEARERFARIVAATADDALVTSSINLIIESYLLFQDWAQVEQWSKKLAGLTRDPQMKKSLKAFELGARFNRANELMTTGKQALEASRTEEANKKLDEAGAEFVRLVDDDPKGENSDKALNNAALCYTWSNRPVTAGAIYERIVSQYPKSEFADQALFLMAGSAEAGYLFQRAIDNYLKLVERYKDSKFRADALFNAAVALEGDQQYNRAAEAFERYAKLFPERPDAPENFFRAALVLEKKKDWREVIALCSRFIKVYSRSAAERERLVMAQGKIGEAYEALGDTRRAREAHLAVVKQFAQAHLPAGGRAAEAGAKAKFLLAEMELKRFEAITFDVPASKLKATLNQKAVTLKKMEDQYKQVWDFKRVQWTLAAYFRLGYLYENFADVLTNAPCPRGLNQEECDVYKGKLMDFAEAPIKKAVAAYEETMEKSRSFKVVNDWTRKALESLNRFEPLKYPLQKEPESALVIERHAPGPLLQVVESGLKPEGK